MSDILEPTAGRSRARYSRRTKAAAATLSLLAAGIGATLVNGAGAAQAATEGNFRIAVVVPWQQVNAVHSFTISYVKPDGAATTTDCYTNVKLTDAMNYWSVPYTTDNIALNPATVPFSVKYFESPDCNSGKVICIANTMPTVCGNEYEIATVSYVGDELAYGRKYVYPNKTFVNQFS